MAEVKWIKITTDIFDDEKVLLIESLPDAYAIITCWFKLLCMAGKQNNSGVFMMGQIAYTDKMLATIFRMKESTVQLALQTFEQFGMIEIVDGVITIPNWNKHQSLDSYEKKKERDRLYKRERRAAQRALIGQSSDMSSDSQTPPSSDVAVSEEEKEREKEGDKKVSKKERTQSGYDAILAEIANESLRETYLEYIKMRKMIKSPMTDRALQMLVNKVQELEPYDVDRQKALLEQAILNNWKSVYPLKDQPVQQRPTQQTETDAFMAKLKSLHSRGGA